MKKITCKKLKLDVNGNRKYLYNFIDTEQDNREENNKQFSVIGTRTTKKGIFSQVEPARMSDWISEFGFSLYFPCSYELERVQKKIDNCNHKNGCRQYCIDIQQHNCSNLREHSKLMKELSYYKEFLHLNITQED